MPNEWCTCWVLNTSVEIGNLYKLDKRICWYASIADFNYDVVILVNSTGLLLWVDLVNVYCEWIMDLSWYKGGNVDIRWHNAWFGLSMARHQLFSRFSNIMSSSSVGCG